MKAVISLATEIVSTDINLCKVPVSFRKLEMHINLELDLIILFCILYDLLNTIGLANKITFSYY